MKNLLNKNFFKVLACILVVTQSFLFALVATFYLNQGYINKIISGYPNNALNINIKNTDIDKSDEIQSFLYEKAQDLQLFYIRKDIILQSNGEVKAITIGVYGDLDANIGNIELSFLGKNIMNYDNLSLLLKAQDNNKTLGLETSSLDMISKIPKFTFGENIVVKKLQALVESSTINGQYSILGLDENKQETIKL